MISVKNVTKYFGGLKAVDDVSFDIKPGDVVGFLGPNGAGKSTTMKMLTGFLRPSSGEIRVADMALRTQALTIKKRIGYLPEGAPAWDDMTVFQFLNFIARVRGLKGEDKKQRIDGMIEQIALQKVINAPIETLSKGFKRRVGLAQALIHDPEILILDEPTDGLDPNQKHQVRELIRNLAADKIVIISTHILEEVSLLCNRVMIIADGKLKFDQTPEALLQRSRYHNAVRLTLSYMSDASFLADLDGVESLELANNGKQIMLFAKTGKDILHQVNQAINHHRLPVDTLSVEQGKLDDVFRQMTQGDAA